MILVSHIVWFFLTNFVSSATPLHTNTRIENETVINLKRDTALLPFIVYADNTYQTQLVISIQFGTSIGNNQQQKLPTIVDLGHSHLLVPDSCSNLGTSSSAKINKRDGGVCPFQTFAGGYDSTKSATAQITPGLFQDHDFDPVTTQSKLKLRAGSVNYQYISVRSIRDTIIFGAFSFAASFGVYAMPPPNNLNTLPTILEDSTVDGIIVTVAIGVPITILGLAPPHTQGNGYPLPLYVVTPALQFAIDEILNNPSSQQQHPPDPPPVPNSNPPNDNRNVGFWIGGCFGGGSGPHQRRDSTNSQPSQVIFRGWDTTRFTGALTWFTVAGVPLSKYSWQLSLRNVQVGTGTSSNAAKIAVNPSTNSKLSMDTIQLDTTRTYILLTPMRVSTIYNSMGNVNFKAPSINNARWTYRCSTVPTISFEFVDVSNNSQLLTMNSEDFYHGLSSDSPGWCNGAIQELPSGATQQLAGLSFFKSFYTVIQVDSNTQAYQIGYAVSKRCGDT